MNPVYYKLPALALIVAEILLGVCALDCMDSRKMLLEICNHIVSAECQ
jgi:hypothetical protein